MTDKKFGLLRRILRGMGLSKEAADSAVDFIVQLLAEEQDGEGDTPEAKTDLPYHLRDDFLSAAELSYFKVLHKVIGKRVAVFTKVGLRDVFYVQAEDRSQHRTYLNKIDRKHVDFLLCHPKTLQPIVGIELDDKSHQRKDRQERDAFVDSVFEAAGLPILHVPVQRGYSVDSVVEQLRPYFGKKKQYASPEPSTPSDSSADATNAVPSCPKCDTEMVRRTATRGKNAGNEFWGCPNYPRCRGTVAISVET